MPFPWSTMVPRPSSIESDPAGRVAAHPAGTASASRQRRDEREAHDCRKYRHGAWVGGETGVRKV